VKIPRTLGRYEVVDLIGRGGMGALYRARDPRIGRYVAIKQLRPEFDTPELRDRFSREAAAAGGLSHPNIVTIFDVGEDEGLPFIAMEYVRGETFTDVLGLRPPLSVLRKLQLVEEVCAGLAHAHEAGIVHRDIKPANLIVGSEGIVKILDFGIAKLSSSGITLPGMILGTLNYMAPEQVRGEAVDARVDIFAVGAVLYELLTHRQAFPGRASSEVLDKILRGTPAPIAEVYPDVDPRLVDLVAHALEKNRDQRIPEVALLQKELANIRLRTSVGESRRSSTRTTGSNQRQTGLITPPPTPASGSGMPSSVERNRAATKAQIEEHLIAAEREFEAGNYDAAIEACKRVLMLDDSDERAIAQLDRIHAAFDEQQALADLAAQEQEAQERLNGEIEDARRRFAKGEHQTALKMLEALDPSSHDQVSDALVELRSELRQIEEDRRIAKERAERRQQLLNVLANARTAIQHDQLDEAARLLDVLRDIDAEAPEVSDFTERLRRAQTAARLKAELDVVLRDFDAALAAQDIARARDLLNDGARLMPNDMRVDAARRRLDQIMAEIAAREAAEARAREAEAKLADASAQLESGNLSGAADLLKQAGALAPNDPRVDACSARLQEAIKQREIADLIATASKSFEAAGDKTNELTAALRDVDRALTLEPERAEAVSLKAAIEKAIAALREAARVKAVISNARTRFANGKPHAAIRLLEDFQPSSHPDVVAALAELRAGLEKIEEEQRAEQERLKKQARLAELFGQAQTAIGEQRFDAALDLLATAAELDADSPELIQLRERVQQEQEALQLVAELEATLTKFDERLTAGDLPVAKELLAAASELVPTDPRVQTARERLDRVIAEREAAEARVRDLEEKQTAAEAAFERGDLQESLRLITLAQALDADHRRTASLFERVQQAVAEQEAAAAAEQRRQEIETLVATAKGRLDVATPQAAELALAVKEIDRALNLEPEHAGALALKTAAQAAVAAEQKASVIRASIRNARTRFNNGKHQAAFQLLESLDPAANPIVEETIKELRAAFHEIEERRRIEQERLDRERQLATHIGTARAAINAGRFKDALDALAAARLIDETATGLAELTEQAQRGQSGKPTGSRRVDDSRSASDADATRVILLPPKGSLRPPDEKPRPPQAPQQPRDRDDDDGPATGTWNPEAVQGSGAGNHTWMWIVAAAVAVVLLLALGALYRYSRTNRVGAVSAEQPRSLAVRRLDSQGPAGRDAAEAVKNHDRAAHASERGSV
jgi:eukaryotic-like serine/threonine-protein kinase